MKDLQELVTGEGPGDNAFSLFTLVYLLDFYDMQVSLRIKMKTLHVHMCISPKSVAGQDGALWSVNQRAGWRPW